MCNLYNLSKCFWLCFSIVIALAGSLYAQTTYSRSFGTTDGELIYAMSLTSDGGSILAGAKLVGNNGTGDILVLKLNASGTIAWRRVFSGAGSESASSISQTSDGGYILSGSTFSCCAGSSDALIIKLTSSGNITWRRVFGGTQYDSASSISQTSDGGYIVTGSTSSFGAGNFDLLVFKLNSSGNITWRRTFGGTSDEYGYSIMQTSDGGYLVAGTTYSTGTGYSDGLVLKLNAQGNISWRRTFGGGLDDYGAGSIMQASDGGYIVAGGKTSFSGDSNALVLKYNSSGGILWRRQIGGASDDSLSSVSQTSDGSYILSGSTQSFGSGLSDALIIKLNSSGNIVWKKTFGGTDQDVSESIFQMSDGNYLLAGHTYSFGAGASDVLVSKVNSIGIIPGCNLFTSPALTIAAPALAVTALALTATAPTLSAAAPAFVDSAPTLSVNNICP